MDGEGQERSTERDTGITRRQVIRKAAVVGGSLVWAAPVVQAVTMRPAFAQATSPGAQPQPDVDDKTEPGAGPDTVGGSQPGTQPQVGPQVLENQPGTVVKPLQISQPTPTETQQQVVVAALQEAQETLPKTGIEALELGAVGAGLIAAGWTAVEAAKHAGPGQHRATTPTEDVEPAG